MSSFALHIWAMLLMLCDHLQLTLLPDLPVLRCIGRLAFPLFAFMAVEGYLHTRSLKNYLLRLLMLAVISEIPFDLLVSGSVFDPMHQNVIWTIILGLCCIRAFENISADLKKMLSAVVIIASLAARNNCPCGLFVCGRSDAACVLRFSGQYRALQAYAAALACVYKPRAPRRH